MVGEASHHSYVCPDAPPLLRLPGMRTGGAVFDQDKLLAVSENCGDIVYTYEFEKFKQTMGSRSVLRHRQPKGAEAEQQSSLNQMLLMLRDHPTRPNYLGLFADTIEVIGAVTFFSAFFFFFSLFLGLLSPILNTSNHTLTQLYSIPEIIAISSKTKKCDTHHASHWIFV